MTKDRWARCSRNDATTPPTVFFAITPSDTLELTEVVRFIYVGGDGNVTAIGLDDETAVTFIGLKAGTVLPGRFTAVKATGTTAKNLIGMV